MPQNCVNGWRLPHLPATIQTNLNINQRELFCCVDAADQKVVVCFTQIQNDDSQEVRIGLHHTDTELGRKLSIKGDYTVYTEY